MVLDEIINSKIDNPTYIGSESELVGALQGEDSRPNHWSQRWGEYRRWLDKKGDDSPDQHGHIPLNTMIEIA